MSAEEFWLKAISLLSFTVLAVNFDKWGIVLFALIFWLIASDDKKDDE